MAGHFEVMAASRFVSTAAPWLEGNRGELSTVRVTTVEKQCHPNVEKFRSIKTLKCHKFSNERIDQAFIVREL